MCIIIISFQASRLLLDRNKFFWYLEKKVNLYIQVLETIFSLGNRKQLFASFS